MHRTPSGDRRQSLQKEARELARDSRAMQKAARAPAARREAERLQDEAEAVLAEAQALKLQARMEDLTVWRMEKVKQSREGSKTYTYWMASWREGGKTRNVHLGSARKMDGEAARQKARGKVHKSEFRLKIRMLELYYPSLFHTVSKISLIKFMYLSSRYRVPVYDGSLLPR
jgi:predicted acyl esterase